MSDDELLINQLGDINVLCQGDRFIAVSTSVSGFECIADGELHLEHVRKTGQNGSNVIVVDGIFDIFE